MSPILKVNGGRRTADGKKLSDMTFGLDSALAQGFDAAFPYFAASATPQ
jgi:hypothetical protein